MQLLTQRQISLINSCLFNKIVTPALAKSKIYWFQLFVLQNFEPLSKLNFFIFVLLEHSLGHVKAGNQIGEVRLKLTSASGLSVSYSLAHLILGGGLPETSQTIST